MNCSRDSVRAYEEDFMCEENQSVWWLMMCLWVMEVFVIRKRKIILKSSWIEVGFEENAGVFEYFLDIFILGIFILVIAKS